MPKPFRSKSSILPAIVSGWQPFQPPIVLGDEPRPTFPEGANDRARTAAEKLITNWDFRHAQAREAIINALPEQLLVSVYRIQQVTNIWQWLRNRLGAISDLEYSLAEKVFRGLVKPERTSMLDFNFENAKNLSIDEIYLLLLYLFLLL